MIIMSSAELRQLRHVGRNPPGLILGQQLGRRIGDPAHLIIDVEELLSGAVLHDESGAGVLDRPGRAGSGERKYYR